MELSQGDQKHETKDVSVYILTDPLLNFYGPLRPPFLIARELRKYFDIAFISPSISKTVAEVLDSHGFKFQSLNKRLFASGSLLTFEAWLRRITLRKSFEGIIINFSQCFLANSHVYYAQGPITRAVDDMHPEMRWIYRVVYSLTRPLLVKKDRNFNRKLRDRCRLFIANSVFCESMYKDLGISVDHVIYPPLDRDRFKPSTSKPLQDYILTYVGKESEYSILKSVADSGVIIKAFGSKAPYMSKHVLKHPNIRFLSYVSDEELVNLYSNALFTLFAFTHEPFGYIPVESMACSTPVLTYNKQGPSETVVNSVTGWLVNSNEELIRLAIKIWRDGYPSLMRNECRKRALEFSVNKIVNKWLNVINVFNPK